MAQIPDRIYRYPDSDTAFRIAKRRIVNNALRRGQKSLDLSNFGLSELPPEIGQLKELQHLFLNGNKLTKIPDFIGGLSSLTRLYLSHNSISLLSSNIGALKNLSVLDLEDNELGSLPDQLRILSNLESFDLGYNKFDRIPSCVFSLRALSSLVLQHHDPPIARRYRQTRKPKNPRPRQQSTWFFAS
jgi:Leucine-rich repeat (LRR) protein